MLIDKVIPFYTDQDRLTIAQYNRELDNILEDAKTLTKEMRAQQEADPAALPITERDFDALPVWLQKWETIYSAKEYVIRKIEWRYIDSFNGDIDAILADVREIVDATEKEEYIAWQKRSTAYVKKVLGEKPQEPEAEKAKASYDALKRMAVKGYDNCYYFILARIKVQLNALQHYAGDSGAARAIALVEEKAASFYKKPKGARTKREPIARELPIINGVETRGGLMPLPTGPALSFLYEILGQDPSQIQNRKHQFNRNQQLIIETKGDMRRLSYSKDKTTVSVEIDDFRKLVNRAPQTKKILTRILLRANEQAIHNGELYRDKVSFPLRELVGEGQYKTLETARQGFYNVTDTLTGLKVSGKIERGTKKTIQQGAHAVLFKGAKVNNATCEIYLNELLNWGLITPYYTGLPDYYFELPDRAAELLEYIFSLARQNTKLIAEQGYFTISYRAIQYRLNLPNEIQNGKPINNPKRDIKDAIETAIEQIEEKYSKYAPPIPRDAKGADAIPDFSLLPMADYDAPIKKYLDEGKLKVSLKGDYAKRFIEISRKTAAKLEAAQKRQERIEDRAIAINLAKSLEEK